VDEIREDETLHCSC
jgi:hypothetical protein